jgi:hypothetical protein
MEKISYRLMPPSSTGVLRVEASIGHKNPILGNIERKRGYLEFETLEDQKDAYEKLTSGEASIQFGTENRTTGFWKVSPTAEVVEVEEEAK